MEYTGWAVAVIAQRREERGSIPLRDPAQEAEMELERALARVKDTVELTADLRRDRLDRDLAHEVEVEFGP